MIAFMTGMRINRSLANHTIMPASKKMPAMTRNPQYISPNQEAKAYAAAMPAKKNEEYEYYGNGYARYQPRRHQRRFFRRIQLHHFNSCIDIVPGMLCQFFYPGKKLRS